jgi:hypothetical protein
MSDISLTYKKCEKGATSCPPRVTTGFKVKSNAQNMCTQKSSFHTYQIENRYIITKITLYNIYYTNNIFNKRLIRTFSKHSSRKTP